LSYKQVEKKGLPFDVAIPKETTRKRFSNSDAGRGLIICSDTDDMFKKLGISCSYPHIQSRLSATPNG
jgi:DNA-damage-inducible protein J